MNTHPTPASQLAAAVDQLHQAIATDRAGATKAVELIGAAIADALRPYTPTVVAVRDNIDDAVLAHVVSRELDLPTVRVYEDSGLLSLSPLPDPGARAALLAVSWHDVSALRALRLLLAHARADVMAVAAALPVTDPVLAAVEGTPIVTAVASPRTQR
ncbi:hypothetical protein ONA91_35045 [Micromonospora sp. DR5-3]|uniref:hypothetical protein n=1 Tax=unclassified Micromonospora TaxID=2617518 RepID=UPI0011D4450E|nr:MULTISPECIES: hypothetical protein [unclassified Micromonospora]MCW3819666.1 hypothetical protein [Micromonospora sp. DR5-3]TYC19868.1 hypothetical protein FXF52_34340 [Micromonospora sp. MP36]